MNKTSAKVLLLPLVMASASVIVGCTDNDYDFNEIDVTLGLGGDELVIPTSSTKEIALDDILKLNEGDCVKILPNGDYVFNQEGGIVDPAHPEIEKVTLLGTVGQLFDLKLDDYIGNVSSVHGKKTRAGENSIPINVQDFVVLEFEYDAEQPEILSLTSANVDANMTIRVNFSENVSKCIDKFDEMTLTMPEYMVIDEVGGNVLKLTNVPTNAPLVKNIHVSKLNFNNMNVVNNGKLRVDGNLKLGINTVLEITPDKLSYLNDLTLKSEMTLDKITINSATGKFDPKIDLTDLGDVEVSGTPDFLNDDDVVIDLENPQILVEIKSDMNIAAKLNATLTSTKGVSTLKTIDVNNIKINPNTLTQICICRNGSKVDAAYVGYDKYEVANLSELIRTIPDRIKFTATTAVDNTNDASFELGHQYNIEPSYSIVAPIAFGKDASIVYTDSIDGLYDDLDGLELAANAYIEITADVENKLPVYLNTKVIPTDINGNNISQNVKITVESNIPAAGDGETAKGTLKIVVGGDIKQLEKLKFTMSGKSSDGTQSMTGITLNKNKHSLKLDNINAKLVGKLIYDAN